MRKQSKRRQEELVSQFPLVGMLMEAYSYVRPCHIAVQKTGPEVMSIDLADNVYKSPGCYLTRPKSNLRGTMLQFLYAAGRGSQKIQDAASLDATDRERREVLSKEIFAATPPEEIRYLVYVRIYQWYKPSKRETFGAHDSEELQIVVFPEPEGIGFAGLIDVAERQKKEREEAYTLPPKNQPALHGLHIALRKGYRAHAFRSGGGLRVISFSKVGSKDAYGEHPHIEEALMHADEDYQAGGRPYGEVYGPIHTHYLTGESTATSNIDSWLLQGRTFDLWQDGAQVVAELQGYGETKISKKIMDSVLATGEPATWTERGYTYRSELSRFGSGSPGVSTGVVAMPEGGSNHRAFMYRIRKTGRGNDIHEALQNALATPEVEATDLD